jgi:hypothetical protein
MLRTLQPYMSLHAGKDVMSKRGLGATLLVAGSGLLT